jgi:hypothetical protein
MEEPLNNPMSLASFSTMNLTEKTRQSKLETLSFLATSSIGDLSDDHQAEQEKGPKHSDVFKLPPQGHASHFVMREEMHASDSHGLVEATVKNEDNVPSKVEAAASAGRSSSPDGLVQALIKEVASLTEQYACLQTEHDDLHMDHDDLKTAHDILETAHHDLKREYTEFKRDMMQKWLDLAGLKPAPVSHGIVNSGDQVKSGDPVGPASTTDTAQTLSVPHALHVHQLTHEDPAMTHEDALTAQGSLPDFQADWT